MKIGITIIATLLITTILLTANKFLPHLALTLNSNTFINALLKFQSLAFILAIGAMCITLKVTPESKHLLTFGNLATIAEKEVWLGINGKTSWKSNGIQFSFFISMATAIFMFLGVYYTDSLNNFKWSFIPLILLISLTNSFSEEIIYRFVLMGNIIGSTPKLSVLLISAILFGLPHFAGFPSGIIGVIMAGLLGYILSKATYETQGIGLAWTIHFIQDVIIFTAIFMMNTKN